jgi:hypothetical protein
MVARDKRRTPRMQPFVVPCRIVLGMHRLSAYITDLSLGGGRVHADGEVPNPGTLVTLEVRIGKRVAHSRIPAVVKWSQAATKGGQDFGLTFEGLSPGDQKALQTVVDEFHRRAAQIA